MYFISPIFLLSQLFSYPFLNDFSLLAWILDLSKDQMPTATEGTEFKVLMDLDTKEVWVLPLLLIFGLVANSKPWQYSFQTPHNDAMFWIIDLHADIMTFLVFLVCVVFSMLLFFITPIYYTKTKKVRILTRKNDYVASEYVDLKLHNHDSFYEMVWTVLPILLEFFIILPSFIVHYAVSQTHPYYLETKGITTANTIRVIGNQWYWVYQSVTVDNLENFAFATTMPIATTESYLIDPTETQISTGLRMLEVDTPLILNAGQYYKLLITSDDVIHSWALPSLNVKVDACPGRLSELVLQIKDSGIFYGQCSELCGYYHGNMPIMIVAGF